MIFNRDPPRYCSYLLRCWQEQSVNQLGPSAWRFSLDDPHTSHRHGFATFDALMTFLKEQLVCEQLGAPTVASSEEVGRGDGD